MICRDEGESGLDVLPIKVSEEAINGVSFWHDRVGVSTRGELIVARRSPSEDDLIELITASGGAHGILATSGGRFFAPMGAAGLLSIDFSRPPREWVMIDRPDQAVINFYKIIALEDHFSHDLLACAARTSGLLLIRSEVDKSSNIMGLVSQGVDFIDVCPVASSEWPHAVVGLSLDRTLIFVRDLLAEETPQTLRLGALRGTPYSILSEGRHLFVLTSKELVVFPDLLPWYLSGEPSDQPFRYRYTPIQAVDAYIVYGKHLMVVMDDEVKLFEIPRLVQPFGNHTYENGYADLPGWSEGEQLPNTAQPSWNHLTLSA